MPIPLKNSKFASLPRKLPRTTRSCRRSLNRWLGSCRGSWRTTTFLPQMPDSWPTWPPDVSSPAGTLRKLEIVPIWWLAFVAVFQTYDYFSSSVSLFQVADGFRDLIQFVPPVDHR